MQIDTPKIVEHIRQKLWKMGYVPSGIKEMAETTEREGKPY